MSGSASVMARFLALAFFIVVAMGIYTFMVKTDLQAAQAKIAAVEKDRDGWKTRLNQYQDAGKTDKANFEQCTTQVKDLQAQLEAASKKTGKR
jgi:septal ring factor EnvC (AmiA/AmiB activator)